MARKGILNRSTPFVAGLAAILAVGWGVYKLWPVLALKDFHPVPPMPGDVNLIAASRLTGYKIIVSNGTAHLVEITDKEAFDAPDTSDSSVSSDTARLPIRETLRALQGDLAALSKVVMAVNKTKEDEFPSVRVVWTAEDIEKAIKGDPSLRPKLEADLNTRLDGTPLDTLSRNAIVNGIVIDLPVRVNVPINGVQKSLVCRVQEPYKTLFAGSVEKVINTTFNITAEKLVGTYRQKAQATLDGSQQKEDVAYSLRSRIDEFKAKRLAEGPERILANINVLVNESHMTGASFDSYPGPNRSILCNVKLRLTDDGRKRLWLYSHQKPGFQLLLTVNGVAVAAPVITTELAEPEVTLVKVPSKDQVEEAVLTINKLASGNK